MKLFMAKKVGFVLLGLLGWYQMAGLSAVADDAAAPREWLLEKATISQRAKYNQDLRDGTITDPATFDYVIRWKLSRLTHVEELFDAPKVRQELMNDLEIAGRADASQAHDRIVKLSSYYLTLIVNDRSFHAGTRYNALLLIGDLNVVEGRRIGPTTPPQGSPGGLTLLVDWLDEHLADSERQEDIVPLGALIGILRHATLGIADEPLRQRAMTAAMKLASQTEPPKHRSPEGHDWLRRRSVQVLGWSVSLDKSPVDTEAAALVLGLVDDSSVSLKLQVDAALAWSVMVARAPKDFTVTSVVLPKYKALASRVIDSALTDARARRPSMPWSQTRRVIATRLANLANACRNLRVDSASSGQSPSSEEINSLGDLHRGLVKWSEIAANPNLPPRQTVQELTGAMRRLGPTSSGD